MAQRAKESIQCKLGGRIRSGEGSGYFPWKGKGENGKHQESGWKEDGAMERESGQTRGFAILHQPMFCSGQFPSISSHMQALT